MWRKTMSHFEIVSPEGKEIHPKVDEHVALKNFDQPQFLEKQFDSDRTDKWFLQT